MSPFFFSRTFDLFERQFDGQSFIFPDKVSVTIDTMLNLDGDFNGHGDGDVTCKHTLTTLPHLM